MVVLLGRLTFGSIGLRLGRLSCGINGSDRSLPRVMYQSRIPMKASRAYADDTKILIGEFGRKLILVYHFNSANHEKAVNCGEWKRTKRNNLETTQRTFIIFV